jgi:glycosyltransferase involved in cell wall biosynthesis
MPDASDNSRPLVIALGVFPPPVTGMSVCTERVATELARRCRVYRANVSDGSPRITWSFRIRKFLRMLVALAGLAVKPSLRGAVLYMPLNATTAMYYNIAAAAIARVRGWRTVVHHHVYLYLRRRDWRVWVLDRLMGRCGLHLPLCPDMRQRLIDLYSIHAACAYVPSTIMLVDGAEAPAAAPAPAASRPVRRLGHISNLTQAKGAIVAIQTFEQLRAEGRDVELVIAGPATEPEVEAAIVAAQQKHNGTFDYRGPVYGPAKEAFFNDIDVLLFPSTFRYEAQPIVLSEAFAVGKPALSYGISCIPSLSLRPEWQVCPQGDYLTFAGDLFKHWQDQPAAYAEARQFALDRAATLTRDAEQALTNLTAWVCGENPTGFIVE